MAELEQATATSLKYKRVLLKLSGEALMGDHGFGIDPQVVARIAAEIKDVHGLGVQRLLSGAATFFEGSRQAHRDSTACRPITWVCSPPSSMRWRFRTRSRR